MALDNDTRGWIMASVSGLACIFGASIICIDILVRLIPRWRNFKVQDSNAFLASSLSLSFGVMLFSALYNMLPSSKSSLIRSGMTPTAAAYTEILCFLGGVIGIQILSAVLHRFIPSHVVDCDHAHKDNDENSQHSKGHRSYDTDSQGAEDDRPLLSRNGLDSSIDHHPTSRQPQEMQERQNTRPPTLSSHRRPSLRALHSFMSNTKLQCGEGGPCLGYSNPCGNECYKTISRPGSKAQDGWASSRHRHTTGSRTVSNFESSTLSSVNEESAIRSHENSKSYAAFANSDGRLDKCSDLESNSDDQYEDRDDNQDRPDDSDSSDATHHHHHHVASNAFLSIGLQTSIAIALHKLPEGFITYATNHANPKLGFSVFMALFIHNITEGFALALPLYLALNSRVKSMILASILGGASQPLGAGIAVLWFKVAQSQDMVPSESVYGIMFAITSGIMTSVAFQLFAESLTLTHNKALCLSFAFVGIGILGISNALTA